MRFLRFVIFSLALLASSLEAQSVQELYKGHDVQHQFDLTPFKRNDGMSTLGYYNTDEDRIHLMQQRHYFSKGEYNHTALHELGHWARHELRLGPIGGSYEYPDHFEEIVVDISAMIMGDHMGIPRESERSIKDYIDIQLKNSRLSSADWKLLKMEVKATVEYLLKNEVSDEKITKYFSKLKLVVRQA